MKSPLRTAAVAAASVAALALGCSKSSGPTSPTGTTSYPFAGSWQLTWLNVPTGTSITPAVDTVSITDNATVSAASYKDFTWVESTFIHVSYTALGGSITITGSNVVMHANDATDFGGCYLSVSGTLSGTSITGSATQSGASGCPTNGSWSWTAIKL